MRVKYTDLDWAPGKSNIPGFNRDVYCIPKSEIVTWPTLPKVVATKMGELVTYTGKFVLAATAKFTKVNIIPEKSDLDGKSQGAKPSKTFLNQFVGKHPGTEAEASAFAMQANNDDMVWLVKENNNGLYRVFGNEMFESNTDVEQKLPGSPTDEMGTTITVNVTDVAPGLYYDGEIVTEDGTINPSV